VSRPAAPIASIFLTLASWPEVAAADRFQYPAVPDGPAVAPGCGGSPGPPLFLLVVGTVGLSRAPARLVA